MFKKHHISLVIVIISLLGIASQKHTDLPNQEILVQFVSTNVNAEETANIICSIKTQLKELGVDEVNVNEANNGKLRITYHSNSDVSRIKDKLTMHGGLKMDLNTKSNNNTDQAPSSKNYATYNLDVYEIKDISFVHWDLNGVSVSGFDSKYDHFFNPNKSFFTYTFAFTTNCIIVNRSKKFGKNTIFTTDKTLHRIPEVRAGPTYLG